MWEVIEFVALLQKQSEESWLESPWFQTALGGLAALLGSYLGALWQIRYGASEKLRELTLDSFAEACDLAVRRSELGQEEIYRRWIAVGLHFEARGQKEAGELCELSRELHKWMVLYVKGAKEIDSSLGIEQGTLPSLVQETADKLFLGDFLTSRVLLDLVDSIRSDPWSHSLTAESILFRSGEGEFDAALKKEAVEAKAQFDPVVYGMAKDLAVAEVLMRFLGKRLHVLRQFFAERRIREMEQDICRLWERCWRKHRLELRLRELRRRLRLRGARTNRTKFYRLADQIAPLVPVEVRLAKPILDCDFVVIAAKRSAENRSNAGEVGARP